MDPVVKKFDNNIYQIDVLMEDKEFLEIYKQIFVQHKDEEDNS